MQEFWKDIDGFPDYQVSNLGNVKSLERKVKKWNGYRTVNERILKAKIDRGGYQMVGLCSYGKHKNMLVHRLVACAFLPNPDNLPQVNHIDENKLNNNVSNLEWCTREYNNNYGSRTQRAAKANSKSVKCLETGIVYPSAKDVERQLGFSQCDISRCCNGKRYKTVGGYHWKYV